LQHILCGWRRSRRLRRPNSSTLFGRRSPLAFMVREGRGGIEAVLRHLHKLAFGGSVTPKPRRR
jgi:hypothetical protein